MIPITTFAGQKVAVFGLGHSGLLSARALIAGGAEVIAFDDAPLRLEQAAAAGIPTQNLSEIDWSEIAALVLAPGVPLTHPTPHWTVQLAHKADVEIIGDIELFCRERAAARETSGIDCPLVAITGTNGKSTTTALISHLINAAGGDAQMGGNIGVPVLELEPFAAGRSYVLEVSSYQIDLAPSLRATVGILLNVSEDHLDRHGSMENYAALKALLPAQVEQGGTAVIGVDDKYTRSAADRIERAGRKVVRVSVTGPLRDGYYAQISDQGSRIVRSVGGKAYPAAQLAGIGSLRGAHNAQNAACAVAACVALGLELPVIQKGLVSFPGLAHRMQPIGRKQIAGGTILYVNDSKATNADSAAKALGELPRHFLDRRRQAQDRRHRKSGRILAAHPQRLPDRRGRRRLRQHARGQSALRNRRPAVAGGRCRHPRRRSLWPERPGDPAIAGLRLVRPVSELRSARQSLHRPGAGPAGGRQRHALRRILPAGSFIKPS